MERSMHAPAEGNAGSNRRAETRLSYKFQRLRERLRAAIATGELSGKLPGERKLAKQFHVNAKTLSKALTDLAAEGLLDRSIGRGTFIKGSRPQANARSDRWVLLCDPDQAQSAFVNYICQRNPGAQVVTDTSQLRPSLLNQTRALIIMASRTSELLLRDLVVRNITVVLVGKEPQLYSVHSVMVDRMLGAQCLGRDLMLRGHRRLLVVEQRGRNVVAEALRRTAERFAVDATVDPVNPADVPVAIDHGATAILCDSRKLAAEVRGVLEARAIAVPDRVSLAAVGSGLESYPCSGYFVHSHQKAEMAMHLIRDQSIKRPTVVWMTGTFHDLGTIGAPQSALASIAAHAAQSPVDLRPTLSRGDLAG